MHLEEPQLAVVDPGVGLVELGLALAERLHLGALQHDAGLEGLEELVLAPGAAVRGDRTVATALLAGGRPLGDLLLRPGHEGYEGTLHGCSACPATMYMEMVAHCLSGLPDEACGLLVGSYGGDEATHLFVTANAAASAMVYEIDPKEMLRVDRAARALGADIMGVFHSHTHTDAYPSPTDVAQATDPGWHYVLVSLRDTHPVVRSYRILDGEITEEPVEVPGLDVPGLEVPGLEP